jgi:pyruvate dehydrogenase E2 component (dihydrolipoamide acetyltransferase)
MAVEVIMPKFGLTMHDGTIQRFFKAPGDPVREGEPLFEVETEKVLQEVEAPASGIFAFPLFEEGATVDCGATVAIIAEPGEDLAQLRARYGSGASAGGSPAVPAAPAPATGDRPPGPEAASAALPSGGRRAISPVARKLATELGVNLDTVAGTGPGGRVTREDVERAARQYARAPIPSPKPDAASVAALAPGQTPAPGPRTIPFRAMRRTIAERMHQSLRDSAQLTIMTEADVTAATELRERLKREFDFTYTDLLIHAVARALLKHPRMNARLDGDAIVIPDEVNIGLAVALEEGLVVPVIRDAARLGLGEIAARSRALGEKARAGKLRLEDVSGGTFTITNLGAYGIDAFTPILNPGETGILGVGRIVEKPAVYRGEITRRAMMTLSLTFDHRTVDGAPAAEFLRTVIEIFNYGER